MESQVLNVETQGRLLHEGLDELCAAEPRAQLVKVLEGPSQTREEFVAGTIDAATALMRVGVMPGNRVALMLGNRIEVLWTFFGTLRVGAICAFINAHLRGDSLARVLIDCSPTVIVTDLEGLQKLEQLGPQPTDCAVLLCDQKSIETRLRIFDFDHESASVDRVAAQRPVADIDPFRTPCAIQYTSGTTGPSKGILCSHSYFFGKIRSFCEVMRYGPEDIAFTSLPLFHANALVATFLSATLSGGQVVFAPEFSARRYWSQVVESSATVTTLLGNMATILASQPPSPVERQHNLRLALCGPWPRDWQTFEERFRLKLTQVYGLTDSGTPIGLRAGDRHDGSCGRALDHWECSIVNEMGNHLSGAGVGELVLRPRERGLEKLGYWNRPEDTIEAWRDLWIHTGDIVRRDGDGYYYFVDRGKDSMRRGGENVSSLEVEQAIVLHDAVAEAAAVAAPSELSEDEIRVFVVAREGARLDPAEVRRFIEPNLPYFAIPRYWDVVEDLPRTPSQKIRKAELRQRPITPFTVDFGQTRRRGNEGR